MRLKPLILAFALLPAAAGLAYAKGPVSGNIQAYIVSVGNDGSEKITEAKVTEPGQVMEFQIVFTNNGPKDVYGIQVVDPIPANTLFIGDSNVSDVPAAFEVSIDGGVTFEPEPVLRKEIKADGTVNEITVPPEKYTHVRWLAEDELDSNGGQHKFTYRVTVK